MLLLHLNFQSYHAFVYIIRPSRAHFTYMILVCLAMTAWCSLLSTHTDLFLPRDASAERGYEIAFVCLSVRPSVRNNQVP